jgi:predicted transcriptional regulator
MSQSLIERPRDRLEILADIVEFLALSGPEKQTRIMQACNLKHDQVVSCLHDLMVDNLVSKDETENLRVTNRGTDFLKRWKDIIKEFLGSQPKRKKIYRIESRSITVY